MQFDDMVAEHATQKAALEAKSESAAVPMAVAVSAGGKASAIDAAKVPAMTVKALKEELGSRGLAVTGKKGELVTAIGYGR